MSKSHVQRQTRPYQPRSISALIFDVDGTLADTEELHRQAFNRAFAELGLAWEWSVPRYRELLLTAGGRERIRAHWQSIDPGAAAHPDAEATIAAIHACKTRHYEASLRTGTLPLRPGIEALLEEARSADIPVAIATTTTPANLDALLAPKLGRQWRRRFAVIRDGHTDPVKKPAPDVYLSALGQLGLAGGDVLAFEDTHNGLTAACEAGIAVVVTPTAYSAGQDFSRALLVLPHLGDPDAPLDRPMAVTGRRWVDLEYLDAVHEAAVRRATENQAAMAHAC